MIETSDRSIINMDFFQIYIEWFSKNEIRSTVIISSLKKNSDYFLSNLLHEFMRNIFQEMKC